MSENQNGFKPEITAFMCMYCGYMAAETAGSLRIPYPSNVKLVRLPCAGKTDPRYILKAFEDGADGVYVVACPIGNCHHAGGNERGQEKVKRTQTLLKAIGLEPERLDIFFMSGGQGRAFADAAIEMTHRIQELGPNPLKGK